MFFISSYDTKVGVWYSDNANNIQGLECTEKDFEGAWRVEEEPW